MALNKDSVLVLKKQIEKRSMAKILLATHLITSYQESNIY